MSQRRITILEIAKHAGVTDATVSRALRNSPLVKETTRQRVLAVAKELNYRKSTAGQGLSTGRTCTFGLITPSLRYPLNADMAECILLCASQINHGVLVSSVDNHDAKTVSRMRIFCEHCVDGVILQPAMSNKDISCIEIIRQYNIPFVVSADVPDYDVSFASFDNYDGVSQLTRHLLERGYRRPALITSWSSHTGALRHVKGFRDTLQSAGRDPSQYPIVHQEQFDSKSIEATIRTILEGPARVDSMLITDVAVAMQIYHRLRSRGVKIGPEFGLAVADEVPWWDDSCLSVTSIRFPVFKIAQTLVEMLQRRIENQNCRRETRYFKAKIFPRDSTKRG